MISWLQCAKLVTLGKVLQIFKNKFQLENINFHKDLGINLRIACYLIII